MQSMSDVAIATQMHRERMAFAEVHQAAARERAREAAAQRRQRRLVARLVLAPRVRVRFKGRAGRARVPEPVSPIRLGSVVLDCSDPDALAEFYRGLLGGEVGPGADSTDLVVGGQLLSFHAVPDYQNPHWPDGHPEYVRLDLAVSDFVGPHSLVTSMGAVPLDPVEPPPVEQGRPYRIYADPAGHPFSLHLV